MLSNFYCAVHHVKYLNQCSWIFSYLNFFLIWMVFGRLLTSRSQITGGLLYMSTTYNSWDLHTYVCMPIMMFIYVIVLYVFYIVPSMVLFIVIYICTEHVLCLVYAKLKKKNLNWLVISLRLEKIAFWISVIVISTFSTIRDQLQFGKSKKFVRLILKNTSVIK